MIDLILRRATGTRAAIAVVAFGVGGMLLFRLSPYEDLKALLGGASLPEESITSPERFAEVMKTLGAAGRDTYLQFQAWDLLNPVLLGLAAAMLLGWLIGRSERSGSAWRFAVLLPVVLLASDVLENVVIASGIASFPDRAALGIALPLVTTVKFAAAIATFVVVVLLVVVSNRHHILGPSRRAG